MMLQQVILDGVAATLMIPRNALHFHHDKPFDLRKEFSGNAHAAADNIYKLMPIALQYFL